MHNQLNGDIQNAILTAIDNSNFQFDLPNLSEASWAPLLSSTCSDERDRLEFVGDGLLHSVIGIELYKLFPLESPHFYSTLRNFLNSNATFAHLMVKVGAHVLNSSNSKKAADAFEMCIAAYHMEHGFETLCLWVSNRFRPLMLAAANVFDNFRQWEASLSRNVRCKANVAFYTKRQKPRRHKTLARYSYKQQIQQRLLRQRHSRTPGTSRARAPATPTLKLFATPRPKNHNTLPPIQPASVAKMKTIIDLTLDSDSEEEQTEEEATDDVHTATTLRFRNLRQFVRTHRNRVSPPESTSSSSSSRPSPMAKRIDKLSVTLSTPIKDNRLQSRARGLDSVVGTLTNPITIDNSDSSSDEDGWDSTVA